MLRAFQGLAAALMSPAALSIVLITFAEGPSRNRALAYWTLVATGGGAVGLLLGGFLTQFFDWQWNFFINVPVGLLISLAIWNVVPRHEKEERSKSLDLPGALLVTASLITLVFGVSEAPQWGWLSGYTLGHTCACRALAGRIHSERIAQRASARAVVAFQDTQHRSANVMMALLNAGMLAIFFISTLYLQTVLHYSPLMTGLAFLPFPAILAIMSTRISPLVARFGFKPFLILGPALTTLGMLWLSFIPVDGGYLFNLLPTFVLMSLGMGVTFMPVIAAATSGVPAHEAGLASGLINTSQQMGGALGLSILTGIAASVTASAGAQSPIASLVLGYDRGILAATGFMLCALLIGAFGIRPPRKGASAASHVTAEALG